MNLLQDDLPCALMRTDFSGQITAANTAFALTLGYGEVSEVPDRLDAVLPGAGRLHYQLHVLPVLAARGGLEELYLDLLTASGTAVPMLINLKVSADGSATEWALMRVTQRARWETAMLDARREAERKTLEAAESAAKLAQAIAELKENNWMLRRVAEVLPTCMYCGRVKAGEKGWETAIEYMKRNTTFLSHGSCPTCAEAALRELEEEERGMS